MIKRGDVMVGSPRRVLVVDDEVAICVAFQRILHKAGFEVQIASDGRTAADLIRSTPS
jgi:DNA-binding response OmpR family regulator